MDERNSGNAIFARDETFWNNYLKERPQAPSSFFDRIFEFHEKHGGKWETAHDAGAGNGPYAQNLRSKFQNVIISDVNPGNVQLAEARLGNSGFRYRTSRIEEADDIATGSVDFVFATNVMHFADQELAMDTIARQLKPGGTVAVAGFAAARFYDEKVQDIWARITAQGGRAVLKTSDNPEQSLKVMERSSGPYNLAPLDERFFKPGAQRIHLNMEKGGLTSLLPPEYEPTEPNYTGPQDVNIFDDEAGWSVKTDLAGLKAHFASFPFSALEPEAYAPLWQEMEELFTGGKVVEAYFPAKVILATRA